MRRSLSILTRMSRIWLLQTAAFTMILFAILVGLYGFTALAQTDTNTEIPPLGQEEEDDTPYGFGGADGGDEVLGREISPQSELLGPSDSASGSANGGTPWQRFTTTWFGLPFWAQQMIGIPIVASLIFALMVGGSRLVGSLKGRHVRRAWRK